MAVGGALDIRDVEPKQLRFPCEQLRHHFKLLEVNRRADCR